MNKFSKLSSAIFLVTASLVGLSQESSESQPIPLNPDTPPQTLNAMSRRNITTLSHDNELLQLKASKSADVERHIELAGKILDFLKGDLPRLLDHYDALLRGEGGLLYSDEGRFLAQNGEFVETMLRWILETRMSLTGSPDPNEIDLDRVDLGVKEREIRIGLLVEALEHLEKNGGETFDPEKTPSALQVMNNATWASKAFKLLDSRIALLEGYLASVPNDVDVSNLPTLDEEVKSMFARRVSAFESQLNAVELAATERRAELVSKATENMRETELQDHLENMKGLFEEQRRLDQMKAEKEKQEVVIASDRISEQIETKYKRELAAANERTENLRKELKMKDLEIDKVTGEIHILAKELELAKRGREFTPEEKALISILTSKGYWKPVTGSYMGGCFDGNSKYDGVDPVPHSLTVLAAVGALDDDVQGYYKLYLILANKCDDKRPRFQQIFRITERCEDYINNPAYIAFLKTEAIEREFIKSDEARATMDKLKKIQGILREFGDELVRQGLLAP